MRCRRHSDVFVRMWLRCEALERLDDAAALPQPRRRSSVTPDTAMRKSLFLRSVRSLVYMGGAMERLLLLWDELDDLWAPAATT